MHDHEIESLDARELRFPRAKVGLRTGKLPVPSAPEPGFRRRETFVVTETAGEASGFSSRGSGHGASLGNGAEVTLSPSVSVIPA
jgi:hypothetical protein